MGGFWEQLQFAFYSKQFGRKERLQFYESMSTLLENGGPAEGRCGRGTQDLRS